MTLQSCKEADKTIVCWGDSLTATSINWSSVKSSAKSIVYGDCSYPSALQDLLGDDYNVINCGVGGENTLTIMGRQGASAMKLAHDVTIYPSERSKYKIHLGNKDIPAFLSSYNDSIITPLLQNTQHFNPVCIEGKQYEISSESNIISYIIDGKHKFDFEYNYYIEPLFEITQTTVIPKGSLIETSVMHDYSNPYAVVVFMGENEGYKNNQDLINQYQSILNFSNCDKYIIVSFHKPNGMTRNIEQMKVMEDSMSVAFGKHYINLRQEMVNGAEEILSNDFTPEDRDSVSVGQVPPSLLSDGLHFTSLGYKHIAKLVFNKFKELNY